MSTIPPLQPPQYPPPQPGMDPRDYAKAQRQYYKAWARQQKDQWRAQRFYWYGRRRSLVGPVILITLGVILLLVHTGHVAGWEAWEWFGHWWPAILIAAGIGRLVEWTLDRNSPYPPRSSGFAGLIVLIVLVGLLATSSNHWNWHQLGDDFDMNDNGDMSFLHGPEHEFDSVDNATVPEGAAIQIISTARGDVSVTAGTAGSVQVTTHKRVNGRDEGTAQREADSFSPQITTAGNVTTVRLNAKQDNIRGNMQIVVPPNAPLTIELQRGDLSVTGQQAPVTAQTHHGDFRFSDITGGVTAKGDHGDLNAQDIHGDVTLNGTYGDVNVNNLSGRLTMDGDFEGDLNFRTVNGPLHYHSTRTDLDVARIADQLTMDNGDMHGSELAGPFRLKTRDFNIDLNNVSGDVNITNADGDVDIIVAKPLGNISIDNRSSSIRVTLPQDAGFQLDAETDGDISNDFGIGVVTNGDHKTVRGTVGNGGVKVNLSSNNNDISIRRGGPAVSIPPAPPTPPAVPSGAKAPPAPAAPKLSRKPAPPKSPPAPSAPEISNQ